MSKFVASPVLLVVSERIVPPLSNPAPRMISGVSWSPAAIILVEGVGAHTTRRSLDGSSRDISTPSEASQRTSAFALARSVAASLVNSESSSTLDVSPMSTTVRSLAAMEATASEFSTLKSVPYPVPLFVTLYSFDDTSPEATDPRLFIAMVLISRCTSVCNG